MNRISEADKILYEHKLLSLLENYGKPYIVGSYRMDLMSWNDIDIYVDSDTMSHKKLYNLSNEIFDKFIPTWFEGKGVPTGERTDYFIGFETEILGDLWNIDIWFFSGEAINNTLKFNDEIAEKIRKNPVLKEIIINIKTQLQSRNEYGSEYTSVDVYNAVINQNVKDINEFYMIGK